MQWFRRLAEVPKVGYSGSPGVDRKKLPGYNASPRLENYEFDGKRHESFWWPLPNGGTSASPARSWQTAPRKGESPAQTELRQLYETLELPGTISDYHFAIQSYVEKLWSLFINREQLAASNLIEPLCWLDIRLVEAFPDDFKTDFGDSTSYYAIRALGILIRLYEQEGYLYEALDVAQRAVKLDQEHKALEKLQGRIAQLEAEVAN
jgi:hypothetical protein